ncbi:MAG: condensation domain-containing protein [Chloroflexota bacterium]
MLVDVSDRPPAERAARLAEVMDGELTVRYDLEHGPLFRVTVVRTGADDHTLVLSAHHLVCDGMSFGVLQRDLGALYSEAVGAPSAPIDDPTQYAEYVAAGGAGDRVEAYWLGLYEDPPTCIDLPADASGPRPARSSTGRARRPSDGSCSRRSNLAVDQGVTMFTVLLAGWETCSIGCRARPTSPAACSCRARHPWASVSSWACAPACCRCASDRPQSPSPAYLGRLTRSTFDAFDHQHHTVAKLASALRIPREASRPTIVSTVMTLETPTPGIGFAGLEATETGSGRRRFGSFEFEAYLTETEDDLLVDFQYVESAFERPTIERWLGCMSSSCDT